MSSSQFSIEKLNGRNWQSWKVRIEMLLSRDDLWYIVSDDLPGEEDRDDSWKKDNKKAKATIILLLEDSQLPLVKNCVFARDVFVALKAYHQKISRSVRVSLLKKLCSINLLERGDLEKHLSEIDELFDRLDAAGMELDSDTKICMLLRSLPQSFDGIVSALDTRSDDEISMEILKSKLMDEYHRRMERECVSVKSEKAMHVNVKESRICHYCKRQGHLRRNCRKYLASQNIVGAKQQEAKAASVSEKEVAFTTGGGGSSVWVIDSGASTHMTGDKSFFSQLKQYAGGWITLANGEKTQILGEGCGVIYGINEKEETVKIAMSDVKYVPGLL